MNGEVEKNDSLSIETEEPIGKKAVPVKSGRGRRAQLKDQIIVPDAIEDHEAQAENIDLENEISSLGGEKEQRNQASKNAASSKENNMPMEKNIDSQRISNGIASENDTDPGLPNDNQTGSEHIPFAQNTVFLTPLQVCFLLFLFNCFY